MKKILILHGALGAKDQFYPLAEMLNDDFEIHLLNFSGHGGETFKSQFNIPQFAQDVIDYLDENKIDKIDVFGYSMGGYVALFLAKHYSETIGKIITLGTKFKWTPEIASKEIKMLNPLKIEEKIPKFAEVLKQRNLPNDWKEMMNKTSKMMIEMGEQNVLTIEDYKTINHIVKIGLADVDEMVTYEETIEVANALPNAQFYQLKNSNHPIEKVDSQLLIEEICSFLS
ncbi:MAG: alpha/beta fold hydrolase [Flavobacteriales bacterium]|nr:alpha/beta fold hydrolase [Flavobacteriales bacterium]